MNTTTFHFELPNDREDLIEIAQILLKTANNLKSKMASKDVLDKLYQESLQELKDPEIRAVFKRLKDK
ncbi:Uncharacterised protein [Campylobacter sputorum subsp. bubulus]|uniref:Uncharacterized protein n=1 Tax=Campylobacter sputorum subsp. sputorum TaxID=32024 RepID=A0A381DJ41_9BACT|nr:hypothetical protein [Campylobacter sputorum]ASM35731.1 hypothetical protein CSPUT_1556 [Campylobacter sputorum aubsp. sputorum RM3237]KAB0580673.1 hypothetical protein F7P64_08620 [Campylobacter sputorum subsp. sputorum]QEL05921.1 hypothetical protein CSPT_1552 [Campylobacter sputorum subsp. sputorum]SUX09011.1 Uncharacterised protein [Campylobacter sputorum subsp. bubulus]SUX10699.1 Uncharacterised protein [Campylobacter sputorum subsp. sputorum]